MNRLSDEKREQIVRAMVEGNSVRSITRMIGVCQEAILKLLRDLGTACADHHDYSVRHLPSKRIQ
jgi:transposase-like protein